MRKGSECAYSLLPQRRRVQKVPKVQYLDFTGVAMVPHHNQNIPWTMVSNIASCRIMRTFFVAEKIKSKMTRECDLGQVNFINKGFENAANLLVK